MRTTSVLVGSVLALALSFTAAWWVMASTPPAGTAAAYRWQLECRPADPPLSRPAVRIGPPEPAPDVADRRRADLPPLHRSQLTIAFVASAGTC